MLVERQFQNLFAILWSASSKLDELLKRFDDLFAKPEHFRACWTIQYLLQHDVLD